QFLGHAHVLEILEALAEQGIGYTVLEPHQAKRWRPMGEGSWVSPRDGGMDTRRPYRCHLPSGRSIDLFFYDGPTSRAVAFEGLLSSGEHFAERLLGGFADRPGPQIMHIATDGETYGHHHRFGDMALAYALRHVEQHGLVRLTNYAEYLALHPPEHEVEIAEQTSWSCAHGIERWRSDCGCGAAPGGSTAWRGPLRGALDWLRDRLRPEWEQAAGAIFEEPWAARDDYIDVVLDRSRERVDAFVRRHGRGEIAGGDRTRALELMELQRHAMLMYTSCGWFFEDIGRIETVQVLQYAARAIQIAERQLGQTIEEPFLERLAEAQSNDPELGDGRRIWQHLVRPAVVSLSQVAAHYAISSLFEEYEVETRVYCYHVRDDDRVGERAGAAQLAQGVAQIESTITGERDELVYCAVHLGDHGLVAGVQHPGGNVGPSALNRVREAFERADIPEALRRLDRMFPEGTYTLRSLFRDEQRRIVDRIVESSVGDAIASQRVIFERHGPLMRYLARLGHPMPEAFGAAARLALGADLRVALGHDLPDVERAREVLEEAERLRLTLDGEGLRRAVESTLGRLAQRLVQHPQDRRLLERLEATVELAPQLTTELDLWETQNRFWTLIHTVWPDQRAGAEQGDVGASAWCEAFRRLGRALRVRIPGWGPAG
ncbi:MAG: DUF3536 domain-containing protein, partial [Polyangiales bacterium]